MKDDLMPNNHARVLVRTHCWHPANTMNGRPSLLCPIEICCHCGICWMVGQTDTVIGHDEKGIMHGKFHPDARKYLKPKPVDGCEPRELYLET